MFSLLSEDSDDDEDVEAEEEEEMLLWLLVLRCWPFFLLIGPFFLWSWFSELIGSIFGLKLSRDKKPVLYDPVNFKCHHPRMLQNKEFNQNFLLRVPVNLGRTSSWFALSDNSLDPMLASLRVALKRNLINNEMYVFLKQMFKV